MKKYKCGEIIFTNKKKAEEFKEFNEKHGIEVGNIKPLKL